MDIYIRGEFTKDGKGVTIKTIDKKPRDEFDIIGIEDVYFTYDMNKNTIYELTHDLYKAFMEQEKYDREWNELHYEHDIDVEFAKPILYENFIEYYGMIDHLTEVKVKDDVITVKYKINNKEKEYSFSGGYTLLREYKLKDYK